LTGSADANLLVAYARPIDGLHARAQAHVAQVPRLRAGTLAVLEAFHVARRERVVLWDFLGALEQAFDIDELETLRAVAHAVDGGAIKTPFDAYHLLSALARGEPLHTADQELLASEYPTVAF
jgi:predicted nucleic acid-binding protein